MAQTITLLFIALIFAIIGKNERNFIDNAKIYSASVIRTFTYVSTDNVSMGKRDTELAKKALVKLGALTDGREGDTVLPLSVWKELKPGDTFQVWAFAEKPKWVFWSPMIRYKKRDIWVKINFAIMSVFLVLACLSHITSIK